MPAISKTAALGLMTANLGSAIEKGYDRADARIANREEAKRRKEVGDLQLRKLQREDSMASATAPDQVQQLRQELQQQQQQSQLLGRKAFREDTYRALDSVFKEQDFTQFNQHLQDANDNPYAPPQLRDTVRIDPLTFETDEDKKALRVAGFDDQQLDSLDGSQDGKIDWNLVKRRFVLATTQEGKKEVRDIFRLGVVTGYGDWADKQGRERMRELADIQKTRASAIASARDPVSKGAAKPSSFAEKKAAEAAYQKALASGQPISAELKAGHQLFLSETGGDKEVRRAGAETAIEQFYAKGFDKLPQEELLRGKVSPEARKLVRTIETQYGMTEADKKRITSLSKVTSLSNSAATLSSKETGVVDKMVSTFSSYVNDETKTKMGKMAYGALMNSVRHSLFGSAQTDGELKLFKSAYGSLGQQAGTVLGGLSQALQQVRAEIGSIADRYPEPVVQMRLGKSRSDINKATAALDDRIEFYNLVAEGKTPDEAHAKVWGSPATKGKDPSQVPSTEYSEEEIAAAAAALGL